MHNSSDRQRHWDARILEWEAMRYDGRRTLRIGPGELLFGMLGQPTRDRQRLSAELLAPFVAGRSVLELGCGTGRLAQRLLDAGCAAYTGADQSPIAIAEAERRYAGDPLRERMRFVVGEATKTPIDQHDIIMSLGLLDWLSDDELAELFRRQGSRHFLHSFSERRLNIVQLGHRFCRAVDAVWRPREVRPRYMRAARLADLMPPADRSRAVIYRDANLRFAVFISSLPLSGAAMLSPDAVSALT